jgi:quercetin dioxygenase-like cupin family protein
LKGTEFFNDLFYNPDFYNIMNNEIGTGNPINLENIKEVKALDGIFRKTLSYNQDTMLCHFRMEKNSIIPLHNHINAQIGYVLSGKIKFLTEDSDFIVKEGDSYVFGPNEKHGAEILEDSLVIEVFTPYRPEYEP